MSKVTDVDGLDSIFNISSLESKNNDSDIDLSDINKIIDISSITAEEQEDISDKNEAIVAKPIEEKKDDPDVVDGELRDLLKTCNDMVKSAKYLLDTSPDAESVTAAASMISSVNNVISEVNKSVLLTKRYKLTKEIEDKKHQDRIELLKIKAQQMKPSLGQGNTINIQQNNLVPFNQESIVKQLLAEKKAQQQLVP